MKVCCVFSFESPHRGDSNEYTQHIVISINKKITRNYSKYYTVCSHGIFYYGLKNEFEKAMVNESLVFEPLKIYCASFRADTFGIMTGINPSNTQTFLGLLGEIENTMLMPFDIEFIRRDQKFIISSLSEI